MDPLNDGSDLKQETDPEQNSYWSDYFNKIRTEELWTKIELKEVNYASEVAEIMENLEEDLETEILEPEIIMTVDETGQTTPMACGIMVVKSI